jgi:glucose/arabinose dehydrogenase
VPPTREDLKQYSRRPDFALGPHVAALGLAFSKGPSLGETYTHGAFIGMHGSWNRYPLSGYKVAFVPFNKFGYPMEKSKPVDVLTGFLDKDGNAQGRPAGVTFAKDGALLVADDGGNTIWRVSKQP